MGDRRLVAAQRPTACDRGEESRGRGPEEGQVSVRNPVGIRTDSGRREEKSREEKRTDPVGTTRSVPWLCRSGLPVPVFAGRELVTGDELSRQLLAERFGKPVPQWHPPVGHLLAAGDRVFRLESNSAEKKQDRAS